MVPMCEIPVLPAGRCHAQGPPCGFGVTLSTGKQLQLEILSTWGDPHFVGLAGIDIFDADGKRVVFANPVVCMTLDARCLLFNTLVCNRMLSQRTRLISTFCRAIATILALSTICWMASTIPAMICTCGWRHFHPVRCVLVLLRS